MKYIFTIVLFFLINLLNAQDKYWVSYKNKSASEYSINNPEEFLSEKALSRRTKFNIPIDKTDLPVCKKYVKIITDLGVELTNSSKWLNGSMLIIDDVSKISLIKELDFVKSIHLIQKANKAKTTKNKFDIQTTDINAKTFESDYGAGENQIKMLSGNLLHDLNFKGKGIDIAIMDNGFPSVNSNSYYAKAFDDGRIIKGYDFVNNNDTLYDNKNGNHGNFVISTMVSDIEGQLIGTAPEATYYLFSTEDNNNEGLPEEFNWAMAAEMADTLLGNNAIISTSLGYSNGFDDPSTEHTYEDMDGNTTVITKAADIAASKGILVINSAGNSGNSAWYYITAPSDGDSVLCIGAVDKDRIIASFSSRGPSYDGDVKPNVCAKGRDAAVVDANENLVTASGTSFSCPITAGMAACLWQAFPNKNNMEIFSMIEASSHLYNNPNDVYGYGIPNFYKAYLFLLEDGFKENEIIVLPNPVKETLNFIYKDNSQDNFVLSISNANGEIVFKEIIEKEQILSYYHINDIDVLAKGVYYMQIQSGTEVFKTKFLKD